MLIPDFEIDAMTRVLLPAFRAFYASPEGQAAFDGGGTSRRIHNKSGPATWTGAVCLCSDTIQINNKSEPISPMGNRFGLCCFGGRYGDRTHDLSVANAALSQLS